MSFELCNVSQTFHRSADGLLRDLSFVYAYTDDLLVATSTAKEHMKHLAKMLDRLQQFSVVLDPSKCAPGAPSIEFLGPLDDAKCIHRLPPKVAVIRDFSAPFSMRQLQRFMDTVNFYRPFLTHCADTILLLTSSPRTPKAKAALAGATLLTNFPPDAPICSMGDATSVVVGAVLQRHPAGHIQPLDFFSRTLLSPETRYSTFGRGPLAVFVAIKLFRHFLVGRDFAVLTDHRPLSSALEFTCDKLKRREISQPNFISLFISAIRHTNGYRKEVADALSRSSVAEQHHAGSPCEGDVSGPQL
ncbi:hypothetical protein SprV_0501847200 [Sparganum proliferum]